MLRPVVSHIQIFPIKSLDGLQMDQILVLPSGALQHDRTWALFDVNGAFVNGKRYAAVYRLRSHIDLNSRRLSLRKPELDPSTSATFSLDHDREAIETWMQEYFGFPVALRENEARGFPDDTESPGPTIVSVATLMEIGRWFGLPLEQVRARFRTNIEIDGVPPFWEDRLFGPAGATTQFRIGEAKLEGINPCQRCVVPARDPETGTNIDTFVRRFAELRQATLPDWSARERFNHFYRVAINTRTYGAPQSYTIRVGDSVEILTESAKSATAARPSRIGQASEIWIGDLVVDAVRSETAQVKTLQIRHPTADQIPFHFLAGQFLTVEVDDGGQRHQRCYTIASSPERRDVCEITVKRDGLISAILHDRMEPGTRLIVSAPMGKFTFDRQGSEKVAFIAGGVGITPLMSMLRSLVAKQWPGRIDLIYAVKTSDDIVFAQELERMRKENNNLGVYITVTSSDEAWQGARGRLTKEWVQSIVPDIAEREVRICGPIAMATSTQQLLRAMGTPAHRIDIESFGGRTDAPQPAPEPDPARSNFAARAYRR